MVSVGGAAGLANPGPEVAPRIALGPGAPGEIAEFIARAGVEVVPFTQRHTAALYVDFVGARPPGVEVLSVDLLGRARPGVRFDADLVTDNTLAAASLALSLALRLRPPLASADSGMLAAIRGATGVAASQVPIVISGEIGAGKYNLARLCHHASGCRGPLLTLNCARFDELDTGALLAAIARQAPVPAKAPTAVAAMLFLDELGELSDAAQAKLLQMLQAGERLLWSAPDGSVAALAAPVRFVGATNRALPALVERGALRRELFWRLNVFALEVPPLRQRVGDVALLARYFLRRANPRRGFAPAALKVLAGYAFPGNTLELENLITRIAIAPLAGGHNLVDVPDIRQHLMFASSSTESQVSGWKASREEARREMILRTITAAGGNRAEAARRLGITVRALQYHITKAGLSRRRLPRPALTADSAAIPPALNPEGENGGPDAGERRFHGP